MNKHLTHHWWKYIIAVAILLLAYYYAGPVVSDMLEKADAAPYSETATSTTDNTEDTMKEYTTTESGLQYRIISEGPEGGVSPDATSQVEVHYHGTLTDGTVFDSSRERGETITFGLNQVIAGWTEGLQLMTEGDRYEFYVPANLAYGDRSPSPKVPAGSDLIFDVELIKVIN